MSDGEGHAQAPPVHRAWRLHTPTPLLLHRWPSAMLEPTVAADPLPWSVLPAVLMTCPRPSGLPLLMMPASNYYYLTALAARPAPRPLRAESTSPHGRTRAALPPWLVARRHQWKESTMKPARKAFSTPAGVRAHGAPLGVGNRYGGRDWVDCRPFYPGFP